MLQYSRSHHANRFQQFLSIFFKFKGLTAKGMDTLHDIGLTMSSKWTTDTIEKLSQESMREVRAMIQVFPWAISWDNFLLPLQVFSQTLNKTSEDGNGTAAIIHIKKSAHKLSTTCVRDLQRKRAEGMKKPIRFEEIYQLHVSNQEEIEKKMVDCVLQILLTSEEFNQPTSRYLSKYKGHPELVASAPLNALPYGLEHIANEYMLPSMAISESSYEGNLQILDKIRYRIGYRTLQQRIELATEKVLFGLGDQLTTDRLRGAARARCQDRNSEERLDNLIPVWGWLHGTMAFEKSLHKQYLGTESGYGFMQAFTLLYRHDLAKTSTAGAFHERFGRILHQILEAHLRNLWCVVGKVSDIKDLMEKSPEELKSLATLIVRDYASAQALNHSLYHPEQQIDEVKAHTIGMIRDLLHHTVLKQSIKYGDIGLMEALLPYLLFRFSGGRNSHYCIETLETLQGIHYEWPDEVRDFVCEHCWLINLTGKKDGHTSADRVMEAGIKDIKVSGISHDSRLTC